MYIFIVHLLNLCLIYIKPIEKLVKSELKFCKDLEAFVLIVQINAILVLDFNAGRFNGEFKMASFKMADFF